MAYNGMMGGNTMMDPTLLARRNAFAGGAPQTDMQNGGMLPGAQYGPTGENTTTAPTMENVNAPPTENFRGIADAYTSAPAQVGGPFVPEQRRRFPKFDRPLPTTMPPNQRPPVPGRLPYEGKYGGINPYGGFWGGGRPSYGGQYGGFNPYGFGGRGRPSPLGAKGGGQYGTINPPAQLL